MNEAFIIKTCTATTAVETWPVTNVCSEEKEMWKEQEKTGSIDGLISVTSLICSLCLMFVNP